MHGLTRPHDSRCVGCGGGREECRQLLRHAAAQAALNLHGAGQLQQQQAHAVGCPRPPTPVVLLENLVALPALFDVGVGGALLAAVAAATAGRPRGQFSVPPFSPSMQAACIRAQPEVVCGLHSGLPSLERWPLGGVAWATGDSGARGGECSCVSPPPPSLSSSSSKCDSQEVSRARVAHAAVVQVGHLGPPQLALDAGLLIHIQHHHLHVRGGGGGMKRAAAGLNAGNQMGCCSRNCRIMNRRMGMGRRWWAG